MNHVKFSWFTVSELSRSISLAAQTNTKLCDKFSVSHYPMLFWGPPTKFVSGSWEPKKDKSEILVIDDGRTAERLLNWINKQIGRFVPQIHRTFIFSIDSKYI